MNEAEQVFRSAVVSNQEWLQGKLNIDWLIFYDELSDKLKVTPIDDSTLHRIISEITGINVIGISDGTCSGGDYGAIYVAGKYDELDVPQAIQTHFS